VRGLRGCVRCHVVDRKSRRSRRRRACHSGTEENIEIYYHVVLAACLSVCLSLSLSLSVCVCVCVVIIITAADRQTDRQTEKEMDRRRQVQHGGLWRTQGIVLNGEGEPRVAGPWHQRDSQPEGEIDRQTDLLHAGWSAVCVIGAVQSSSDIIS